MSRKKVEEKSPGYMPRVTPLTHEQAFLAGRGGDEQVTPPENGGWDVERRRFSPVRNYRQLNRYDYDDKRFLYIPLWRFFLDAFSAGVEQGDITRDNWRQALRFSDDWLALGNDLLHGAREWMNERHRNAVLATMLHGHAAWHALAGYEELGRILLEEMDWDAARPELRLL